MTVLNACIEGPEPVHVQIGVKEISGVGRKSGADQRAVHETRSRARFARRAWPDAHALRARDHRGRLRGAAIQRNTEQNLKDFLQRRGKKVPDKDININSEREEPNAGSNAVKPK